MKIYVLRHEIRDLKNPTFYSPLLSSGLENSEILKGILNKYNINLIFSSPFKRVLQTVKPYCDMKNIHVNIEYSLYEQIFIHDNVDNIYQFDKNNFRKRLLPNDAEYYLKNKHYKSYLPLNRINYNNNTKERAIKFMNYIIKKYKNTEHNILLATHEGIIQDLLDNYEPFPMGGLYLCYDSGHKVCMPINF